MLQQDMVSNDNIFTESLHVFFLTFYADKIDD